MRIRLKYPDVETFVEKYSANISEGGMFIQSRAPQPVDTRLRFDLMLHDSTPLLKGEGVVIWVKEYDAAHPSRVHGMGVRFSSLDEPSQAMVSRIIEFKTGGVQPLPRNTITQEVRALVQHASTDPEEPDASLSEPRSARAGGPGAGSLFAALLDEAQKDPPASEPAFQETPAVVPPADSRPASVNLAGGEDSVAVALEMAEQVLGELLLETSIDEDRVSGALRWAVSLPASDCDGELQELLRATALPPLGIEQVIQELHRRAPAAGLPPAATTPGPARPITADFDPSLANAAARTARAARQTPRRGFDLSEREQPTEPVETGHHSEVVPEAVLAGPEPAPGSSAPPADAGWTRLQTQTELLDHDSSEVLRDLAQRASDPESSELSTSPGLAEAMEAVAADSEQAAQAQPGLGVFDDDPSTQVTAGEAFLDVLTRAAEQGVAQTEQPLYAGEPRPAARGIGDLLEEAVGTQAEELGTEPIVLGHDASVQELSREVWRELRHEVSQDLQGTETEADSFFEGNLPEADDDEDADAEPLDFDELEVVESVTPSQTLPDEAGIEAEDPLLPPEGQPSLGDILSDIDIGAIDAFNEYGDGEDTTIVTTSAALGAPLRLDQPDRGEPAAEEPEEAEELPTLRPGLAELDGELDPLRPSDPLADVESESFDGEGEAVRSDPELENEVFEALAGLRDTLRDGDRRAEPAAPNPDWPGAAWTTEEVTETEEVTGLAPPPLEQLAVRAGGDLPRDLDQPTSEELPGQTSPDHDEEQRGLRPRKSGILKRLFGKKE